MTARSTDPAARARQAKREDTSPKPRVQNRQAGDATRGAGARIYPNTSTMAAVANISPTKPLTEKQKLFTKFWAEGESILSAAAKAGYDDNGTYAYRMVKQPNILALKAKYEKQYEESVQMDRRQVMEGFKEAIEMAKLMAEPATMIAGWREIGKLCGYYAPVETKVKVDVTGSVTMKTLTQLSDAELLELIEKGSKNDEVPLLEDVSNDQDAD